MVAGELGELENLDDMLENHDDRLGEVPTEPFLSEEPERARRLGTGIGLEPFFSGVSFVTGSVVDVVVEAADGAKPLVFALLTGVASLGCSEVWVCDAGAGVFGVEVTLSITLSENKNVSTYPILSLCAHFVGRKMKRSRYF